MTAIHQMRTTELIGVQHAHLSAYTVSATINTRQHPKCYTMILTISLRYEHRKVAFSTPGISHFVATFICSSNISSRSVYCIEHCFRHYTQQQAPWRMFKKTKLGGSSGCVSSSFFCFARGSVSWRAPYLLFCASCTILLTGRGYVS
ncbi:hypothetical protein M3J09_003876 [Ascochyta lentis]